MLIALVAWVLLGASIWFTNVLSFPPRYPLDILIEIFILLPLAVLFGPLLFILRYLKCG